MRGVAADEGPPFAEAVRHHPPPDPVLLAEQLVLELGADAEQRADAGVAVDRVEPFFVRQQVVVDQPSLATVDGHQVSCPLGVVEVAHPGVRLGDPAEELRGADVAGLHALDHLLADQPGADGLAHQRSPTLATDQITRTDAEAIAGIQIGGAGGHALFVRVEAAEFGAVQQGDAAVAAGRLEQHGLQEDLVDPVRRLGRRPGAVRPRAVGVAIPPAGDVDPHQLETGRPGADDHVVGIVVRQARRPDRLHEPQPAEALHGARGDVIALHAGRLARLSPLDHHAVDAPPGQVEGQAQPHRPRADDRNRCLEFPHAHLTRQEGSALQPLQPV